MSLEDLDTATRKKAVSAISSEVRNYQPGLSVVLDELPRDICGQAKVDASDMDAVDVVINKLRDRVKAGS